MSKTAPESPGRAGRLQRSGVNRIVKLVATIVLVGLLLFEAAGDYGWLRAWWYLGVWAAFVAVRMSVLAIHDPELLNERGRWKQDTKAFDKAFVACFLPFFFAIPIVAGLDAVRFGWSSLPLAISLIGLALFGVGEAIVVWAMITNTYFESTVRIQRDRGHRVVSSGPYRLVRHPGYVGAVLLFISTPLALGSVWSLLPAGVVALLFVVRTALEDRTLRAELPGYVEYTRRIRFRLVPGVW